MKRTFDVGYDLPAGGPVVNAVLRPEILEHVVAIRASVAFTCYHDDNPESTVPQPVCPRASRKLPRLVAQS